MTMNELRRIWLHPLVWIIFSVIFIIMTLLFLVLLNNFYTEVQVRFAGLARAPGVTDSVLSPLFFWGAIIGALILPLFAMRILTEDKVRHQYVLLSSAPVSCRAIVTSKLLALGSIIVFFSFLILLFPLSIFSFTNLDWGKILASLLGVLLFQISYASLCVWLAACTNNLAFSVLSGFGALFLLFVLFVSGASTNSESSLFTYLSNFSHLLPHLSGLVTSQAVIYFIVATLTFSALAVVRLRFKRD